MPVKSYFKGHGDKVMKSIRKAHPGWSDKRVKQEFYATANARNAKPGQRMETTESEGKSKSVKRGSQRLETFEG